MSLSNRRTRLLQRIAHLKRVAGSPYLDQARACTELEKALEVLLKDLKRDLPPKADKVLRAQKQEDIEILQALQRQAEIKAHKIYTGHQKYLNAVAEMDGNMSASLVNHWQHSARDALNRVFRSPHYNIPASAVLEALRPVLAGPSRGY